MLHFNSRLYSQPVYVETLHGLRALVLTQAQLFFMSVWYWKICEGSCGSFLFFLLCSDIVGCVDRLFDVILVGYEISTTPSYLFVEPFVDREGHEKYWGTSNIHYIGWFAAQLEGKEYYQVKSH